MRVLLKNAHIVSPDRDWPHAWLMIENGLVADTAQGEAPHGDFKTIDAHGNYALPGFFDIHSHGRSGANFCDATDSAFETIGRGKLQDGVTSFLATTLSVDRADIASVCRCAANYAKTSPGARLAGVHLEGPFFNPACAGAQNPAHLLAPSAALVREWAELAPVRKITYSPELDPDCSFTREMAAMNIMPSGGHSAADYECFSRARKAGMKHLTHFCNVMTPVHHLRFGMVGGGLLADDVFVEMICDGVHLCDEMILLIAKLKGPDRMMLITDAMRASAMPDGAYSLGGLPVTVKNGRATIESGAVAGSTLRCHEGLKRLRRVTNLPLSELVKTTAWNQARSLGIPGIGKLETGFSADIALLDGELNPVETIVGGIVKWQSKHTTEES